MDPAGQKSSSGSDRHLILASLRSRQVDGLERSAAKTMKSPMPETHSILGGLRENCYALDRDFVIVDVNEPALQWIGLTRGELVGRPYLERFSASALGNAQVREALDKGEVYQEEFKSRIKPGRWLELHAYRYAAGYIVIFRDITERKESVRSLEQIKGLLDATLNAMSPHVTILEHDGKILRANVSWNVLASVLSKGLDATAGEYLKSPVIEAMEPRHALALRVSVRAMIRGAIDSFQETVCVAQPEGQRWYQVSGARLSLDGPSRIVLTHEDVTALHTAHETIQDLSQRLMNVQEEERRRIAQELHDSTSQQLIAIGLHLMALRRKLDRDSEIYRTLDQVETAVDQAQSEIRTFSYLLHPPHLDREGLRKTLVHLVEGFSARADLSSQLDISDSVDSFKSDVQRTLLRLVQEALANAHRHADATKLWIKAKTTKMRFLLVISDNGKGMGKHNPDHRTEGLGLGLAGMRDRVSQLGGSTKIMSSSQGTTIIVKIPLSACR